MGELTRILHVEDEADIREIANMALELIGGFQVAQAELGTVALDIVGDFKPELLLCDVQMPGLTGPETIAKIREMPGYEQIPAIYMTAKVGESDKDSLLGPYELGFIAKPFDPTTLATQIREMWAAGFQNAA
ncbi:response regulator [Cognatishimia activa]|uniref:Phosphate regulon transcriptional regulatory protein PhoB n=1 Tax=Cognatishimia activa TaxID=1715691 RepID=A0A0P1IXN5_9RHOB|nr:response regulator [Cognatishimia activa]MEE2945358.1 response regulator [Pseudomonadota bacterium]CUI95429.1 Phosphate regulon transcriptional regulatory protein PhoB [Cognatishimia activa]CUK25901.1 Phosphate regulon transcriptional regulatory protein PhoB [Cognatishimia activa]